MKKAFALALLACSVLGCAAKQVAVRPMGATGQELPTSLSGRWRFPTDGSTQVFSLKEIQAQPDNSFTAKLTWWQTNPWCTTRDLPIVGRRTEFDGIAFDVPRVCGISYVAELNRSSSGWVGKASSMSGYGLVLDLRAD